MKQWCLQLDGQGQVSPRPQDAPPAADGFVWSHFDGREADTKAKLESGGLPAHVIHALLAIETRPRCEPYADGALINLRGLGSTPDDDADPLVSVRAWAERGRVVTVTMRSLAATDTVREAMDQSRIKDPGDLIVALAKAITLPLDAQIAQLGDMIDDCEADLEAENAFAMRRQISRARSEAIGFRRFVVPQRQALEEMAALEADWLEDDDRIHLRDAADRFARMAEELEAVRERSALLHEQLTDLRAELTETRTLVISVVALVFLPLTFVTGLFGMNYPFPFEQEKWPFWAVLGFCAVAATAISGYFIRAHWFRR